MASSCDKDCGSFASRPFAVLFAHVTPSARSFFTGKLCHTAQFSDVGYLHLFTAGVLTVVQVGKVDLKLHEPTLLFYPRGGAHSFVVDPERGADLVCATVQLGGAEGNPIGQGLPELVVLPLATHAALHRLLDYLLILIVRHVVASGSVTTGVLAGLADSRLAKALTAMHEAPKKSWTLGDLADVAGMSCTRFAERFRMLIGRSPIDYLTNWRMTIARQLLAKGKPVKNVATQVGYESAATFSRVFSRVAGQPPREFDAQRDGSC